MEFKEILTERESEEFPIFKMFAESSSYKEDFGKALKFAGKKRSKRKIYTMVDGENNKTFYLKGLHYVNRFGFCVLGVE